MDFGKKGFATQAVFFYGFLPLLAAILTYFFTYDLGLSIAPLVIIPTIGITLAWWDWRKKKKPEVQLWAIGSGFAIICIANIVGYFFSEFFVIPIYFIGFILVEARAGIPVWG